MPNFESKEVMVRVLGKNSSKVADKEFKRGETCSLGAGGKIELVTGYSYHVFFGERLSSIEEALSNKPQGEAIVSSPLICALDSAFPSKRRKVDDEQAVTSGAEVSCVEQRSLETFFKFKSTSPIQMKSKWNEYDTLILFSTGQPYTSRKIAAFDLDGTLIETISGKKFASGPNDWKFKAKVPEKLRSLHSTGFRIVIFTNQAGMPKGKPTKEDLRKKLQSIADKLGMHILVLISSGHDIYRKPCVGMWDHMVQYENGGLEPDLSCSFFVGDAAGRFPDWKPGTCTYIYYCAF